MSGDKKRVQFRAPHRPVDQADALADVLGEDRTDILVNALREHLQEIASYEDMHGRAATAVLNHTHLLETRSISLDAEFPLDDGENAAVILANDLDADLLLCDQFNQLGLSHASLTDSRLVTTLLSILVRTEQLSTTDARRLLDQISAAGS